MARGRDGKLDALEVLLRQETDKVLIFTQFADTVRYLARSFAGAASQHWPA